MLLLLMLLLLLLLMLLLVIGMFHSAQTVRKYEVKHLIHSYTLREIGGRGGEQEAGRIPDAPHSFMYDS
ncbi:uncharacterized, partial [Tachysurus ichikawai]